MKGDKVKKLNSIFGLIVIALFATSIMLYAGDEKPGKKENTKCAMTGKQGTCTDKNAKSGCPGMDAAKAKDAKCASECADKKAKGECKDHDPVKCQDKCSADCKDKMAKGECNHGKCSADCKHDKTTNK